jgi:hypothetical protein
MRVLSRAGRTAAALGTASLVLSGLAFTGGSATAATPGKVPVPASGMYFGAANRPAAGQTFSGAFSALETKSAHGLGLHRTYQLWNQPTISPTVQWDVANGKLPAISMKPSARWSAIANGSVDADIRAQANAFKTFGHPVLLSLHHEPENDPSYGTPGDYIAAWRHYVSVFRSQGATNVSFAWIMMAYSFSGNGAKAAQFYPGDDVIDWIAADGYNWAGCRPNDKWISFATVFTGFRNWAAPHNKPLFIAEVGTEEQAGNPMGKSQWIRDMLSTSKGWPQLKAISWFNTLMGSNCDWPVDSSTNSLNAWKAAAADPYTSPQSRPIVQPPAVVTGSAFGITGNTASVYGSVDPNGAPTTLSFQYGTTTSYGSTVSIAGQSGDGVRSIQAALPNLQPGTTYHYRVVGTNSGGTVSGADRTVTTTVPAVPAAVVTGFAFGITGTTASVYGSVDPNGSPNTVSFQYGTTTGYGSNLPIAGQSGDGVRSVQATLPNLLPGTTYHYRVVAAGSAGIAVGADRVLTTGVMPKGWTWWSDGVRSTSAGLHAGVLPNASSAMVSFQYGTSTAYGLSTVDSTVASTTVPAKVLQRVSNLRPRTTYHYRVVVRSGAGTVYGLDRVVTTTS